MNRKQVFNFPVHGEIDADLHNLVSQEDLPFQVHMVWRHDKDNFIYSKVEKKFEIIRYYAGSDFAREHFILKAFGTITDLETSKQYITANIFAKSHAAYEATQKALKRIFPESKDNPESDQIEVKFWYHTNNGPSSVSRKITVPKWEHIDGNYSANTHAPLKALIEDFRPSEKTGQLILWHGRPGTGKTYALRSLIRAWRKWCVGEYIMDPEALFGYSPSYLIQMLLSGSEEEYYDDDEDEYIKKDSKWRLLILEDTGELLSESAKERSGQGLSRLLNLVDGLIGQGLKVLVLITTNEELEKLHPAVSREGRCAAAIKFEPFTVEEAVNWADKHDVDNFINKPLTLAELFGRTKTAKQIATEEKKPVLGFVPR